MLNKAVSCCTAFLLSLKFVGIWFSFFAILLSVSSKFLLVSLEQFFAFVAVNIKVRICRPRKLLLPIDLRPYWANYTEDRAELRLSVKPFVLKCARADHSHKLLTSSPLVTFQLVMLHNIALPNNFTFFRWSDYETGAVAPPVARTLIWIDTHQTVRIKPRMSLGVPGRWFYTQIVPADAAVINLSDAPENNAEAHTDLVEFAPPANLPSHNQPTTPMEFAHCSALYHSNLTVRFPLELGVTLCGKLIPPIEKVGSHLTLPWRIFDIGHLSLPVRGGPFRFYDT